jgi:hypothetical protein
MFELFTIGIAMVISMFTYEFFRVAVSRNRLQACIDNGSVIFDGQCSIEILDTLDDESKDKIHKERMLYLNFKRRNPEPKLFKLHRRNSHF